MLGGCWLCVAHLFLEPYGSSFTVVSLALCTSYPCIAFRMDVSYPLFFWQRMALRSTGHLSKTLSFGRSLHLKQNHSTFTFVRLLYHRFTFACLFHSICLLTSFFFVSAAPQKHCFYFSFFSANFWLTFTAIFLTFFVLLCLRGVCFVLLMRLSASRCIAR